MNMFPTFGVPFYGGEHGDVDLKWSLAVTSRCGFKGVR